MSTICICNICTRQDTSNPDKFLCELPHSLQVNAGTAPWNRPSSLTSISFPTDHSFITILFTFHSLSCCKDHYINKVCFSHLSFACLFIIYLFIHSLMVYISFEFMWLCSTLWWHNYRIINGKGYKAHSLGLLWGTILITAYRDWGKPKHQSPGWDLKPGLK